MLKLINKYILWDEITKELPWALESHAATHAATRHHETNETGARRLTTPHAPGLMNLVPESYRKRVSIEKLSGNEVYSTNALL